MASGSFDGTVLIWDTSQFGKNYVPENTPTRVAVKQLTATPSKTLVPAALSTVTPTLKPTVQSTSRPRATVTKSACPGAPAPHVSIGQYVKVLVENWDKLKLRSTPEISQNNVVKELDQYSILLIKGGPQCVTTASGNYWFWEVENVGSGENGWVAEGERNHYYIDVTNHP